MSISTEAQRTNIAVGEEITFTCTHSGDSNPSPDRFTFYKDGGEQNSSTYTKWTPNAPSSIKDGGSFSCVASNTVGVAERSDEKVITVEGNGTFAFVVMVVVVVVVLVAVLVWWWLWWLLWCGCSVLLLVVVVVGMLVLVVVAVVGNIDNRCISNLKG